MVSGFKSNEKTRDHHSIKNTGYRNGEMRVKMKDLEIKRDVLPNI